MKSWIVVLAAPLILAASIPTPNPNVILGGVCAHIADRAGTFRIDNILSSSRSRHIVTFPEAGTATVEEQNAPGCTPTLRFRFTEQGGSFRTEVCLAPMTEGGVTRRVTVMAAGEHAARSARQFWSFQSCTPAEPGHIRIRDAAVSLGFKSDLDTTGLPAR